MWLLHFRHDSQRYGSAARETQSHRRADYQCNEWEYLPLRHLPAHSRCGETRFRSARAGSEGMSPRDLEVGKLEMDRRAFLRVLGGGLLVCFTHSSALAQESGRSFGDHELPKNMGAWLHIAADGKVKVFTGKVEVGQNIRTSLAQLVAEELRVPFNSITMVMGDTDLVPWDMGTFGSRTTPTMGPQLRTMAAAAREMLLGLAAERWKIDVEKLTAADGKISNPQTSQSFTYGELTRGEKLIKDVSGDYPLTPATQWKVAGTAVPKAEGRDFVTGKHKYPSDITDRKS